MNRFQPLLVAFVLVTSHLQAAEQRPNIVYILADDQSWRDFGFLGNEQVHTPHLDQLAAESARFPNGYVPMSVCRPSLATFLTGLYPHQHGVHFNHPPPGLREMRTMTAQGYRETRAAAEHLIRDLPTLPRILARHGYVSFQAGKHWEGDYRNVGFTEGMTTGLPAEQLGNVYGTRTQKNGEWVAHGNGDAGLVIGRKTMSPVASFINRHREEPFFLWYAPFLPHTPFNAPEEFYEPYEDQDLPEHLLPYYAEINRFDATVGTLLKALDEAGLRENTLIVFASDNGFRPDQKRHERYNDRSKLSVYEDGLRTPLLLNWPGTIPPGQHEQLVQTIDLLPTVLDALQRQSDEQTDAMQGISLLPAALGEEPLPERPAFGAIYPNDARELNTPVAHARGVWIRDGNHKLILPGQGPKPLEAALYNLKTDPLEQNNLYGDNELKEIQKAMTTKLDNWWPGDLVETK